MYFYYEKIVVGEMIKTPLASSVVLKGLYFLSCKAMTHVRSNTRYRNWVDVLFC